MVGVRYTIYNPVTRAEIGIFKSALKNKTFFLLDLSHSSPVNVHRDSRGKTPQRRHRKTTKVLEGISEAIEAKRTGSVREVDLLPNEEQKLNDLDLELLGLVVDSDEQESPMSEEEEELQKMTEPMVSSKIAQIKHHAKAATVVIAWASSKKNIGIVPAQEPWVYRGQIRGLQDGSMQIIWDF